MVLMMIGMGMASPRISDRFTEEEDCPSSTTLEDPDRTWNPLASNGLFANWSLMAVLTLERDCPGKDEAWLAMMIDPNCREEIMKYSPLPL